MNPGAGDPGGGGPDGDRAELPPDEADSSSAGDFLRQVARAPPAEPRPLERDRTGETFGHFQLTGLLGRGGMGVVYAAFDLTLRRKVALKLLRATTVETEKQRWRLLREAQAAAAANHPNIAAVFETGEVRGEVFIAMELVEGPDMRAWLAARPRSPREILDVFAMAGRGLAAAHRIGLIHRDFKPDNVLIDEAAGRARVADFGLAAGLEPLSEGSSISEVFPGAGLTQAGRIAGTPGYIAPEHLAGRTTDARADQFAFCVALYEALEGRRPYGPAELAASASDRTALPRPPFQRTPPWLRGLVLRGLAPDPERRFPTMDALLTRMERARALPQRALISLAAAAVASLGLWFAMRTNEQAARAEVRARQERNATRMSVARALRLRDPATALALLREVEPPVVPGDWSDLVLAALHAGAGCAVLAHPAVVESAAFSPDGQRVVTASADGTVRLWSADGTGEPRALPVPGGQFDTAAFSPDGRRMLIAGANGVLRLWDVGGGAEPLTLPGTGNRIGATPFSPDEQHLVTFARDNNLRVWTTDGKGDPLLLRGHMEAVYAAAFSPDGKRIASTSADKSVWVWSADGAGEPTVLRGQSDRVVAVAWSPDGRRVATGSRDSTTWIWTVNRTAADPVVLIGHEGEVHSVAWSPDGGRLVTTSMDSTARIWNADGTGEPQILRGHVGPVHSAAFSPDGSRILTAGMDGTARVWDAAGGGQPMVLSGHQKAVVAANWSQDGRRAVTASMDGTARVWSDLAPPAGVDDPRLWTATPYCLTVERRMELLGMAEPAARAAQERCERRVATTARR